MGHLRIRRFVVRIEPIYEKVNTLFGLYVIRRDFVSFIRLPIYFGAKNIRIGGIYVYLVG